MVIPTEGAAEAEESALSEVEWDLLLYRDLNAESLSPGSVGRVKLCPFEGSLV
jgi:hypothetical protein